MSIISDNLQRVRERILTASQQAGRNPADISLLAVSKTKPAGDIAEAYASGQRAFGENYLQDALRKIHKLSMLELEWHFIGAIQSNKTRDIAEHFDWVHTLDREKIARRLNDQRPAEMAPLNVCLQVNISNEPGKAGLQPSAVAELAAIVRELPNLKLRGLMAIPASESDPVKQREPFQQLAKLQQSLLNQGFELDTLSMGMTGDIDAAIAEGATIVRVGTAIFGSRQ